MSVKRMAISALERPNKGNYFIVLCFQLKKACAELIRLEGMVRRAQNPLYG